MKKFIRTVKQFCVPCALTAAAAFPASIVDAAPVLPTDGLVIQLDAGTLTGFSNGDEITAWTSSADGTVFTNYSDSSKPQYYSSVANLGGQAALYFDSDCMTASGTFGISGADERTVIAVWADAANTGANYQHILHMGKASNDQAYGLSVNRSGNDNAVGNHVWSSGFNASLKAGYGGNAASLTYTGGKDYAIVNGQYAGNWSKSINTAADTTLIGSRLSPGDSSTEGIKGYVAEVLVYDRKLTGAEMIAVNSYLNTKYSLGAVTGIDMDLTGAQISLDFENGDPMTGGQYVGLQEDNGNTSLRLIKSDTKNTSNFAYLSGKNSATESISGTFDLRFTNAAADGVSFILAGDAVDITNNYGTSPVGETPSFADSFGIGYTIYNQSTVNLYWDGQKLGTINTTDGNSANPQYNIKDGNWFTTQFQIDYRAGGYGADVDVVLYDTNTGGIFGTWSGYVDGLTSMDSQLLLRGRTGGSTANADFDNIQVKYEDITRAAQTWIADKSGSLTDGANWDSGTALQQDAIGYISGGTQTISDFSLVNGASLVHSAGTTTASSSFNVAGGSDLVITGGTLTSSSTMRIGAAPNQENYVPGSGTGMLIVDGGNLTAQGYLSIGFSADGILHLKNGTITQTGSNAMILGDRANTFAEYKQTGGKFTSTAPILVGTKDGTQAKMIISGGEFTSANAITVGIEAGTADALLDISGGTFVTKGITVNKGAALSVGGGTKLTVNSDTSIAHSGLENRFVIGYNTNDEGNKVVVKEGAVLNSGKTIALGFNAGSYGELVVNGTMNHTVDHLLIGFRGEGKLTVSGQNASVTTKNTILGDNTGGNCVGTLEVLDGAAFTSTRLSVADKNTATGTLRVEDSTVTVSGEVLIGNAGTASASIIGSTFTSAGSFMLSNNAGGSGDSLLIEDSTVTVNGAHMILGRNGQNSTAVMRGDSVFNFNGSGVCGLGEFGDNTVFNMEGGTFNVNKHPGSYNGYVLARNSIQNQSGGTMNVGTKDLVTNLQIKGTSQYNFSGGTLNVTGSLNKDSGAKFTMTEDSVLSTGSVEFALVQDGGTLSPGINWDGSGYAIGTTTLNQGYTLNKGGEILMEIDVANGQADKITVHGTADFANGAILKLAYDPELLAAGVSFDLFDFSDAEVTGWENLELSLTESDLYLWNISTANGIVNFSVNASAVPEPSAWVLLLVGLALGGTAVRKRRKA